jgi:cytochrome c oxidase subunit II
VLNKLLAALTLLLFATPALAEAPVVGAPIPWGYDLQQAFSPMKERLHHFHDFLLWITIAISIFVIGLLVYTLVRFNAHANKKPATFSHNTTIEVIWTVIPVIILVIIGIPSIQLLYYLEKTPSPEMTLKVTGHQWYWSYEYPDQKIESFDSRPIWDGSKQKQEDIDKMLADARKNWIFQPEKPLRLLEVDNRIVLPVDTSISIDLGAADVLHAWAMPALGVKKDAVPGRLNQTWFQIDHEGTYYGQCSELCGTGHGFMPIVIEAVSKEKFAEWVKTKATAPVAEPAPAAKPAHM